MSLKKLFGKKLKQLRVESGLTQEKLAELLDLETGTVCMIELGRRGTSFDNLEKIIDVFNISYIELFDFEEIEAKNNTVKSITKELNELDDKELRFILKTLFIKYKQIFCINFNIFDAKGKETNNS